MLKEREKRLDDNNSLRESKIEKLEQEEKKEEEEEEEE